MSYSILRNRGRTTIPLEIRNALNLLPGDRLTYELHGSEVTIRVTTALMSVAGQLKEKIRRPPESIAKMREIAIRDNSKQAIRKGSKNG